MLHRKQWTDDRREDDWQCTYLEEGSCLAHCYLDFLTAESLQTHRKKGRGLAQKEGSNVSLKVKYFLVSADYFQQRSNRTTWKITQLCKPTLFLFFLIVTCNTFVGARSHLLRERVKVFSPLFFLICFSRKVHPLHNEQVIFVWTGLSLMGE